MEPPTLRCLPPTHHPPCVRPVLARHVRIAYSPRMNDLPAPLVSNVPEYTVSEISGAVKRTLEGNFGRVRVRGEITELKRYPSGHIYFSLKDEGAKIAGVVWKSAVSPARHGAGERRRGDRHRPHLRLRRALVVSVDHRADGVCRRRRPAGPHRDAARAPGGRGAVRRRPQARAAGAAGGGRRGHQRARRGDPGHPHHDRAALPARRSCCGRCRCRARARPTASPPRSPASTRCRRTACAARRADRRARRRQPGRPDGVQRGGRAARRRRLPHPADLRGGARDRHHADRLRLRPPRADADRGGGTGGAGARRSDRRPGAQGGAADRRAEPAGAGTPAAPVARGTRSARSARAARRRAAAAGRPRRAAGARAAEPAGQAPRRTERDRAAAARSAGDADAASASGCRSAACG